MRDETFRCMEAMSELGEPQWFGLGDRDLATHLLRTGWLWEGAGLDLVKGFCEYVKQIGKTRYEANAAANTLRSFLIHNGVFMAGSAFRS